MHQHTVPKTSKNIYFSNRNLLVGFGVVSACLLASMLFPAKNSVQIITKSLFFLVLLPIAYIKLILGEKLSTYGWNLKNKRVALTWGVSALLSTLLLFYLMLNYTTLSNDYILSEYIKNSFWLFLTYELFFVNISLFIFSYFFQGFLLSVLQNKFGFFSILLQTGLILGIFFLADSLNWQTAPFVLLSITGGFLAWKTKSFFYSYFMNFFAIIILDTYIIYLTK